MSNLVNKLREEPVRAYLYGVFASVVAALVAAGVVTTGLLPVILAVGTAVLAVPAVEVARAKVTPVTKLETKIEEGLPVETGEPGDYEARF